MTIAPGIEIPADQIRQLCERYQVRELVLFGSAARGEMSADSDIDMLVEFHPHARIGWELFELQEELEKLAGRKVDLGTKRSLKPWVRENALRDARILYAA